MTDAVDQMNPKDAISQCKIDLTLFPAVATAHGSHALMDGLQKYKQRANWRMQPVKASVYMAAAKRHADAWWDGQELAQDSGVHHLGHMLACIAILIDAAECGSLVDDRPEYPGAAAGVFSRLCAQVSERRTTAPPLNAGKL